MVVYLFSVTSIWVMTHGRHHTRSFPQTKTMNSSRHICGYCMKTRWWFQIFLVSPRKFGKMNPFWARCFSNGLVQPATSRLFHPPKSWLIMWMATRNPAVRTPVEEPVGYLPLFTRASKHPNGGCFGLLNHQRYDQIQAHEKTTSFWASHDETAFQHPTKIPEGFWVKERKTKGQTGPYRAFGWWFPPPWGRGDGCETVYINDDSCICCCWIRENGLKVPGNQKKTTGFQDFPRVWWVPNPSKWAEKSWSIFKDKKKDQLDQRIQLCRDGSMTWRMQR